jgi:hypothetical protein
MLEVEFNKLFFLKAQRQLKAIEFQNLVQGAMMVEQYSARFLELSRFAPNLVPDEESKAERFENGLNSRIKGSNQPRDQRFHQTSGCGIFSLKEPQ